mmetsp:Transcript_51518/g.149645  ORF Transcript_51518/g.149645 Transcript_51518/m.149645 type:complete len:295 (+) Transcript_51518:68-952(+)
MHVVGGVGGSAGHGRRLSPPVRLLSPAVAEDANPGHVLDLLQLSHEALLRMPIEPRVERRQVADQLQVFMREVLHGVPRRRMVVVRAVEAGPCGLVLAVAVSREPRHVVKLGVEQAERLLIHLHDPDEVERLQVAQRSAKVHRLVLVVASRISVRGMASESPRLHVLRMVAPEVVHVPAVEIREPRADVGKIDVVLVVPPPLEELVVLALQELGLHVAGRTSEEGQLHVLLTEVVGAVLEAGLPGEVSLTWRQEALDVAKEGDPRGLRNVYVKVCALPLLAGHYPAVRAPSALL